MEDTPVYADSISRLIALMKDRYGDTFKQVYEGDPLTIPKANYPCIIVEKIQTKVTQDATGTDKLQEEINITLVLNKNDDLGKSDDYDQTERRLRKYVEGRDPATGYFLPDTIFYLLRTNITLGNSVIDSQVDVTYDLTPRANNIISSEARVSMILTERVIIQGRS